MTLEGLEAAYHRQHLGQDDRTVPELDSERKPTVEHDPYAALDRALEPFSIESAEAGEDSEAKAGVVLAPGGKKYWKDTLGRMYPVDGLGNIIRKTNKPFGVPKQMWLEASKNKRRS